MQISGSILERARNQNFQGLGISICVLIRLLRWVLDMALREMIFKILLFTTNFQADRKNTLTIIGYERAVIDNRITITLGFNLLNFTGGSRGMNTDRTDGWVQRLLSGDGFIGQQTCCGLIWGRAAENHWKSTGWEASCIFSLSCEVRQTSEGPNNLLWMQTIITAVRLFLKGDEQTNRRQIEEAQKSPNEKNDCNSKRSQFQHDDKYE